MRKQERRREEVGRKQGIKGKEGSNKARKE